MGSAVEYLLIKFTITLHPTYHDPINHYINLTIFMLIIALGSLFSYLLGSYTEVGNLPIVWHLHQGAH